MSTARSTVAIVNRRGLHARASAKFVGLVADLPPTLEVTVLKDGVAAAGASILGLMMLGAAQGESIDIEVAGEGADDALALLISLVKDGFGEE